MLPCWQRKLNSSRQSHLSHACAAHNCRFRSLENRTSGSWNTADWWGSFCELPSLCQEHSSAIEQWWALFLWGFVYFPFFPSWFWSSIPSLSVFLPDAYHFFVFIAFSSFSFFGDSRQLFCVLACSFFCAASHLQHSIQLGHHLDEHLFCIFIPIMNMHANS